MLTVFKLFQRKIICLVDKLTKDDNGSEKVSGKDSTRKGSYDYLSPVKELRTDFTSRLEGCVYLTRPNYHRYTTGHC